MMQLDFNHNQVVCLLMAMNEVRIDAMNEVRIDAMNKVRIYEMEMEVMQ